MNERTFQITSDPDIPHNQYKLNQLCTKITDGTHKTPYYTDEGIPFFSATNIKSGELILDNYKHISLQEHEQLVKRCKPEPNDVLLSKSGSLGDATVIPDMDFEFSIFESLALLKLKQNIINPNYLKQYLCSPISQRYFKLITTGLAVKHLHLIDLKKMPIYLPSMEYQVKLSDLLSTWDAAIEKANQLIAAKRKQFIVLRNHIFRQDVSQAPRYQISDIFSPITRKNDFGVVNVLTSSAQHGLVSQLAYYKKSVSAEDLSGYYLLKNGEFAYNRSSANGYPYGAIKRLDSCAQGVLSTLYLCFSIKDEKRFHSDFLVHLFESGELNRPLRSVCQEGARSHGLLNITKADFFGLEIQIPEIPKQIEFADTLNTAREEIRLLKKQAEAYRRQKRGLMQKLLTGQWRVKLNDEVTYGE